MIKKKRKTNPDPLYFVLSKTNPLRKDHKNGPIEYEKISRYKILIRMRIEFKLHKHMILNSKYLNISIPKCVIVTIDNLILLLNYIIIFLK